MFSLSVRREGAWLILSGEPIRRRMPEKCPSIRNRQAFGCLFLTQDIRPYRPKWDRTDVRP